jgi:hypothetical protein
MCPYFEAVQGSCSHERRSLIINYLREHPDEPCPVYEEFRAEEMMNLADQLEQQQ